MADRHSKEQRSRNMSRIRKFGNESTELRMVKLFRQYGIAGWRRHLTLPGRPDFAFRRERVAVFVDGCFWHRCPRCNWTPASNVAYWENKFALNRARDRQANRALRRAGWRVVRVWECVLRTQPARVVSRIRQALARRPPPLTAHQE
jgi:DNA mismatch endonuclease (patch repair protein)